MLVKGATCGCNVIANFEWTPLQYYPIGYLSYIWSLLQIIPLALLGVSPFLRNLGRTHPMAKKPQGSAPMKQYQAWWYILVLELKITSNGNSNRRFWISRIMIKPNWRYLKHCIAHKMASGAYQSTLCDIQFATQARPSIKIWNWRKIHYAIPLVARYMILAAWLDAL